MNAAHTTVLVASTLLDALVVGAALFLGRGPTGLGRVASAALLAVPLALLKAQWLDALTGGGGFFRLHLAYATSALVVPAAGLAVLARARRRLPDGSPRVTRPARAAAWLGLLPVPLALWGTFVEPYRLVEERVALALDPARAGGEPLRVAVLSDLQSCVVDEHLREAVRRALAFEPHLILLPGDLMQCDVPAHREETAADFRELLRPLAAPLGVYFVPGNCDWVPNVERILAGTEVRMLRNQAVRATLGERTAVVAGADFGRRGYEFAQAAAAGELPPDGGPPLAPGDVLLLVSHYPDVVLALPPAGRIDLTVAGHTHGGQVQVPLLGPPITLSDVPRAVAAGGLHALAGNRLYVSRGIGCERGLAPRLRLFCPPEVSLLTLE